MVELSCVFGETISTTDERRKISRKFSWFEETLSKAYNRWKQNNEPQEYKSRTIPLRHHTRWDLVRKVVFSHFAYVSRRHSVEKNNQTNVHFLHSVLSVNVLKVLFRTTSRMLYNFLILFFLVSFTVYDIGPLIPKFPNSWRCKLSNRAEHSRFTIPDTNFMAQATTD
ncbi:hypothetical protein AVEN_216277-1 [Araneus ventricosus]|uniref:Uncharacterized protein n=1 Tax=Araneus ventricosus TaxID=182803 RepID=A0A4Y2FT48_ARAVE|nr:hypothetical protein AVEN_216277-1 [Araneus ventricosus]